VKTKAILGCLIFIHLLAVPFLLAAEKNVIENKNFELTSLSSDFQINISPKGETSKTENNSNSFSTFIDPKNRKIKLTKFSNSASPIAEFSFVLLVEVPTLTPYYTTFL